MNKKLVVVVLLIAFSLTAGLLWASLIWHEETHLFNYYISAGNKTYMVTLTANWDAESEPSINLLNSSDSHYPIELYFLGGTQKTIVYNVTIPSDLLWGDISLIRKYNPVDASDYALSNNGTHISLQMTFDYNPHFSGNGYFLILGTEGAW